MKNGGGARGFFCSRPPQTVRENDVKRKSASHVAETGKASKAAVKEGYFVNKVSGTLFLRHAQLVRDGSGQIVGEIPEVSVRFVGGVYVPKDEQGCTADEIKQMIFKSANINKHTFWIAPGGGTGDVIPDTAQALDAEVPTCKYCGLAFSSKPERDAHEGGCSQK